MAEHIIRTGKDGELENLTAADIDEMVRAAVEKGRIVVYFHGGLVPEAAGTTTAKRLGAEFTDVGAYPVFFVWRSGWLEIIRNNLFEIAKEDLFERLLRRVVSWAVGKARAPEGGRGTALPTEGEVRDQLAQRRRIEAPETGEEPFADESTAHTAELSKADEEAFVRDIQIDTELNKALAGAFAARDKPMNQEGSRGVPDVPPKPTRMDDDVLDEIGEGVADGGARGGLSIIALARKAFQVLNAVVARFRDGTDAGVYPTVVDELLRVFYVGDVGGALWNAMKKETEDTFKAGGDRGGRLFLDALAKHLPDDGSVKISLVGHSTGAVFIDNLLRDVARRRRENETPLPETTKFQVVLLAPAATTTHFAETLALAEPMVERLRIFTMDDTSERADRVAGAVYPRSLLYLVSGALERDAKEKSALVPLIGLSRYLSAKEDDDLKRVLASPLKKSALLQETRTYLIVKDRVVLSPTGDDALPGFRAKALSHGAFDNEKLVIESVTGMIKEW
ncbi:hypothetical protein ACFQ58_11020 [Agromyces sp. NPDC056523]|uniref:hypothetical protein n=1 Tax=Agromyces sp. NPDC056523 TaxID=3345850 RepID=UPI00366EBED5